MFSSVQDLLEQNQKRQVRSCIGEASWEPKAAAILDCISDAEVGFSNISGLKY